LGLRHYPIKTFSSIVSYHIVPIHVSGCFSLQRWEAYRLATFLLARSEYSNCFQPKPQKLKKNPNSRDEFY
jgi:hypothetical protein